MPRTPSLETLEQDADLLAGVFAEILAEQGESELLSVVTSLGQLARRARSGSTPDAEALRGLLGNMPSTRALQVARALTHLLSLANIAEQHHRVRTRRQKRIVAALPSASSETLDRLLRGGMTPQHLFATVAAMRVELVLTAHPTQAIRRTVLQKHRRIAHILAQRDRSDLLPSERLDLTLRLRREVLAIWQTDDIRRERPTPIDEARGGLALFDQVLWQALPDYLRQLDRALETTTGHRLPVDAAPVRFATWMGGDRDGNPHVTGAVTAQVCLLARDQAAGLYHSEIMRLHDELSMPRASVALRAKVGEREKEPYRALLNMVARRLIATRNDCQIRLRLLRGEDALDHRTESGPLPAPTPGALPYDDAAELWSALALAHQSLHENGAGEIADGRLLDVLRRLRAYGLCLQRLDVRQEASVHTAALDALTQALDLGAYRDWTEDERIAFLIAELTSRRPLLPQDLPRDPACEKVLETLLACARIPRDSLGAYVVSMTNAPSDVLAVHVLQRAAGIQPPLRVVPLFETLADLDHAGRVLAGLLDIPSYRALINGHQEVMIGYSDSTKDAGRVAAAWGLYRAQEDLVDVCRDRGIKLTLFHGRGGTVGRGGGPIELAILSQPPGSVDGRLRVTIQGETIDASLGLPDLALETLELYVGATLGATLSPPPGPTSSQRDTMGRLANLASEAYRRVVRDNPSFLRYFQSATPEQELSQLNLGSRPARRRPSTGDISTLRAIPWMFAWAQTRLHLPAWLGTGEALQALAREEGTAVSRLARDWPFFSSLLSLLEMVLAKADPRISAYYDHLLVESDLLPLGADLQESCRQTIESLLRVLGHRELLASDPDLRRSIDMRNPYVDPLNLLQAELLRRFRTAPEVEIRDALLVTITGIAAGMRNTG